MSSTFRDQVQFTGDVSFARAPTLPSGSITDAAQNSANTYPVKSTYSQPTGTAIVAGNAALHVAGNTGTVRAVYAAITGLIATGGDRTVTIDVKKSTAGGAFATILTGTIGFTNGSTLLTTTSGAITTTAYSANDIFQVVVTVAGAAGNQAQGLVVTVHFNEAKP